MASGQLASMHAVCLRQESIAPEPGFCCNRPFWNTFFIAFNIAESIVIPSLNDCRINHTAHCGVLQ